MSARERPILFSAPMVRALLSGAKTQTRRIVSVGPCPYGREGDRLWVRETCAAFADGGGYCYAADAPSDEERPQRLDAEGPMPWRPSIHMPRAASRITLEITSVRSERLQDISADDAIAEGCHADGNYACEPPLPYPVASFKRLWESVYGKGAWASNPLVWVIAFRREVPRG